MDWSLFGYKSIIRTVVCRQIFIGFNSYLYEEEKHMEIDFRYNRFNFLHLAEYIQSMEALPDVITDQETGIEFYGANTISREEFAEFLANFSEIDNLAQNDAVQDYKKRPEFGVKSYQFEPSWVEICVDRVCVEYVGSYINTNFSLFFKYMNGLWILDK